MFSVHLHKKLLRIKQIISVSAASLAFLHQNHLLHRRNLLPNCKNQILVSFCSVVNVDLSGLPSRTVKRGENSVEKLKNDKLYTVSYLMNSCGLSPESADSASEKVRFRNSEKPNSVLSLLESQGFSKTQISIIVKKRPKLLVCKEKSLLPKLEFFRSLGMSNARLATIISRDPTLLTRSLENQIMPNYNFLKSVLLTDKRVTGAICRTSWVFLKDVDKRLAPNVKVLRELKVPESCLKLLLTHYPETLILKPDKFNESVSKVVEMGFDPLKTMFVMALHYMAGDANKVTWDRCYEAYGKWGWSEDDIYMAFKKHPNCMLMSEKKLARTMDFLVNKMGWDSRSIAASPTVLFFSLENRTIPRCSVVEVLVSRGLIPRRMKLSTLLLPGEEIFLKKYVFKYEEEVPKLLDFYKGKIGAEEL